MGSRPITFYTVILGPRKHFEVENVDSAFTYDLKGLIRSPEILGLLLICLFELCPKSCNLSRQ